MAEECDTCGRSVSIDEAIRRETFGDLDTDSDHCRRSENPILQRLDQPNRVGLKGARCWAFETTQALERTK